MPIIRDIALILLAAEAFVLGLLPLTILGALIYGLTWVRRHENLPGWLRSAQVYLGIAGSYADAVCAAIVRPVLLIHAVLARVSSWLRAIAEAGGDR